MGRYIRLFPPINRDHVSPSQLLLAHDPGRQTAFWNNFAVYCRDSILLQISTLMHLTFWHSVSDRSCVYFKFPFSFLARSLFLLTIITTRQIIHHLKSAIMVNNHSSSARVSTQRAEAQGSHDSNEFAHQTELSVMKLTIAFKVNTVRESA